MVYLSIPHNAGMGNQLFMFAYAYGIAKKYKHNMIVLMCNDEKTRPIIFKYLKIKNEKGIRWISINNSLDQRFRGKLSGFAHRLMQSLPVKNRHIIPVNGRKYQELPVVPGNIYVEGFWENYKYMCDVEKELGEIYQCDYPLDASTANMIRRAEDCNSVALHIRMGDFVKLGRNFGFDYYDNAIQKMKEIVKEPKFFLITTDEKVKDYYKNREEIVIVDIHTEHQDIDEWNILCHCKHHITTNSTYSWWAAILAKHCGKVILKPSRQRYCCAEGEEYGKNYDDFYPSHWIALEEELQ